MRERWNRVRAFVTGRRNLSEELAEEMREHIEMQTQDLIDRGMSPDAARQAAYARFGNSTAISEKARESWGFPSLESWLQDIRYTFRGIRRSPAFALSVILTFAAGVGLNTAIFSVLHAVVLKPLPYPAQDRLVWFGESTGKADGISVSWINFQHWHSSNRSFEDMAAFRISESTLTGVPEPRVVRGLLVTSPYFSMLGMRPLLGRLPGSMDDRTGADAVVVLSHAFWSRQFGGDPGIVGRTVALSGTAHEVIGVAAPLWQPWNVDVDYFSSLGPAMAKVADRAQHNSMRVIGRLRPGVTLSAARADLDGIMARLDENDRGPEVGHRSFGRFLAEYATEEVSSPLLIVMGAAALILMIACTNVASLLLARNTARAGELAVRTAIGAGVARLVRQSITETLTITALGGALGILLAWWMLRLLVTLGPREIPRIAEVGLDLNVLAFSLAVTLVSGLAAGLAPVALAVRMDVTSALKNAARTVSDGKRRQALRSTLVVCEVALTFILAFGAGLLLQSLIAAQSTSPGFNPRGLASFSLQLPSAAYGSPEAVSAFYSQLLSGLSRTPGITGAGAAACQPAGGECGDWFFSIAGRPAPAANELPIALMNTVTAGYFRIMAVPIRAGREFSDADRFDGPKLAVINEAFARMWFQGQSPIGRHIKIGGPYQEGPLVEVIGVVADIRQSGLDTEARPEVFFAYAQRRARSMTVVVRSAGDAAQIVPVLRRQVASVDRNLPLHKLAVIEDSLGAGLARRRFTTALLTVFASLAMLLAAIGIYGLLSYWVNRSQVEIAIRLALGARRGAILRWTGLKGLRLALAGIAIGAAGAWAGADVLRNLVFGVQPHDFINIAGAAVATLFVSCAALLVPAWRAARIDPARRLQSI